MNYKIQLAWIAVLGISATASAAPPQSPLLAPIHQFIDGFNKGDEKAAAAALAPAGAVIIDDVAPHLWSGANSLASWSAALQASDKAAGVSDGAVTLGKATRVVASAEHGYVVVPAVYNFKLKGAAMHEVGRMVYSLHKAGSAWQITALVWAGSKAQPDSPVK